MQQVQPIRRPFPYALLAVLGILALAIALGSYTIWRQQRASDAPLDRFGAVAPFSLTASSGKAFAAVELEGSVWIANFIFTSCRNECPLMSAEMAKIQQATPPAVKLVSFSVDPEFDRPEVLKAYAGKYQADPSRWFFLTGERKALQQVSAGSFHLAAEDDPTAAKEHAHDTQAPHSNPFLHSQKFVLVDTQLQIRGYYDSSDPVAIKRLLEIDLPKLSQENDS